MPGFWEYEFMRYAFAAVILIMPLFAMLGTLVVSNGMSFFSDALGHSALAGVGLGLLFGLAGTTPLMVGFAVVFALLMNRIRHSRIASSDTVIGVFSSCGVALGLVLLSRSGGYANVQNLLIGDILAVTAADLRLLGGALVAVSILWLLLFNPLTAVSVSHTVARSKGVPVRLLDDLFVVMLAVTVMLSIRWVGLLIVNAMLVLPAAAARNLAHGLRSYHLLALVFGLFSGVTGLLLAYYTGAAAGPMVVLTAGALFFGSFALRESR